MGLSHSLTAIQHPSFYVVHVNTGCVVIHSPDHVPPTYQQIMPLLKGVCNWWGNGGVLTWLGVPQSRIDKIRKHCGSDKEKAVEECLRWWVDHAANVRWSKIIHSLDMANETRVADTLRKCAEPPSGE